MEPEHQRRIALVEDGARCGRDFCLALRASKRAEFAYLAVFFAIFHQRVSTAA